jgi:hypothetical protein
MSRNRILQSTSRFQSLLLRKYNEEALILYIILPHFIVPEIKSVPTSHINSSLFFGVVILVYTTQHVSPFLQR